MIEASRRSFIGGALALCAAPAVVRASSLMPVRSLVVSPSASNSLLTIDMITQEAIRLFRSSNAFLAHMDRRRDDMFEGQPADGVAGLLAAGVVATKVESTRRNLPALIGGLAATTKQSAPPISVRSICRIRLPNDYAVRNTHRLVT